MSRAPAGHGGGRYGPRLQPESAVPASLAERAAIASAGRVVVKIGSSSLTTAAGTIDDARIAQLTEVLVGRVRDGGQVVLVSSGAFAARGVQAGQILLTADDLMRRAHYRNAQRTLNRLLELGILPVVNENDTVATDEIRFGDNDRLAALVAHVIRAGALILLSDVDGLHDKDPRKPGARRIDRVNSQADLAGVTLGRARSGTGGMVTKVDAAMIATEAGIPTVVASADQAAAALAGERAGTYFTAHGRRPATRQLWLAHAAAARGRLMLDAGAVRAVVAGRASLLPAGIIAVEGEFDAGDPVDLCDAGGQVIARGLVNYDAAEVPALMGRDTRSLAAELGPEYEREVVHRDDLVVLARVE